VAGTLAVGAWAQSSAPQAYSYTIDPATFALTTTLKVARDGPKEAVDQIEPAGPSRAKEFHNHILYDFAAHKIYTKAISDPSVPCTVMDYTSPSAPAEFDLFAFSAESGKEFKEHGKQVGKETVNGIPAKVMELSADQVKERAWIADPGGYLVKVVMTPSGGATTTVMEVKQLSLDKPPASAFQPPAGCKAVGGEATATGVSANFGSSAGASKSATKVTAVTLQSVPSYTGSCPAQIRLTGTITAGGAGKVFYQFGAGAIDPGETISFNSAGTQTVTHTMTFGTESSVGHHIGISALLQAAGEDAKGNYDDASMQGSNNVSFTVNCTSAGTAAPVPAAAPATSSAATPAASAAPAAEARVTAVDLKVTPAEYTGVCPVTVQLQGTFTANAPGSAYYNFQAGAVGANSQGSAEVKTAGATTVTSQGKVSRTPMVQQVRFLAGMEPRGHQEHAKWTDVQLNIHCTNAP
jgi:hypothetical protein